MIEVLFKLHGNPLIKEGLVDLKNDTIKIDNCVYSLQEMKFDNPVSGTIYGTLLNYKGSFNQYKPVMNQPPYNSPPVAPILYIKPRNTYNSFNATIPVPSDVEALQVGAAIGMVIGKTATKVREDQAFDYILGYLPVNDVQIPHEQIYRPAVKEMARDGFCPIGPWIVKKQSVTNPESIVIKTFINGELMQESNTANLIRSFGKLLADVTEFMTLYAGDILLVGIPENPPLAKDGDDVKIEMEGIGFLHNRLQCEREGERI